MKTPQPSKSMPTLQPDPADTVQSVTHTPAGRAVTFVRLRPRPNATRPPGKRRPAPVRLKIFMAPDSAYSFEPAIQVRSQAQS